MPADWVAYLVLTQVSFCGLCLLGAFARRTYATRIALISAGAWYALQGIDHLVAGNFFRMGHWEYAIQAAWVLAIYLYLRYDSTQSNHRP